MRKLCINCEWFDGIWCTRTQSVIDEGPRRGTEDKPSLQRYMGWFWSIVDGRCGASGRWFTPKPIILRIDDELVDLPPASSGTPMPKVKPPKPETLISPYTQKHIVEFLGMVASKRGPYKGIARQAKSLLSRMADDNEWDTSTLTAMEITDGN